MAGSVREAELEALNAELRAQNAALRARIEELERRLGQNSQNSSRPPSSDPPSAPERKRGKRSRRKRGGQPGHPAGKRELVAPERVNERLERWPEDCSGCGHDLGGQERESVGEPLIFQQAELPPVSVLISEYVRHRVRCERCGRLTLAGLPAGVSESVLAPRFEAVIATLAGSYRLSRRQIAALVQELFGWPLSTGAIDKAIMRVSGILEDPWRELAEAIRQAEVVHADETSWRMGAAKQWLWVAAGALVACYRIDPSRGQAAAKELLGEDFGGFVVSDRYAGYHFLDVLQQQLCWAHAIRQLVEISEREGAPGRLGEKLVKAARGVIAVHHRYLQEEHTLAWLKRELSPLRDRIHGLLEQGERGRHEKTANFCAGLLKEYDALWTFCEVQGIDPTNNAAERALRHGVILRKVNGGSKSEEGNRFIERILSTRETCRLQRRSMLDYLTAAVTAARLGEPVPTLLPP